MSHSQEVQQKLQQLQNYIPFVERMISKLESRANTDRGEHLEKLKGLYKFLINPDSKLQNIEMLDRMEKIIDGMYKSAGKRSSSNIQSSKSMNEDKHKSDKGRGDSDGHSSHKKRERSRDRRDDKSRDSRSDRHHHHRDHHSSRRERRSKSRERDQHSRSKDRDDKHKSSYQDLQKSSVSSDKISLKSRHKDSHSKQFERHDDVKSLNEKEHNKVIECSLLKEKEKRLFGDEESSSEGRNLSPIIPKDQMKAHSLLSLPMPPVPKEPDFSSSRLNTKPYLGEFDNAKDNLPGSNEKPSAALNTSPKDSNMDIIKKRLGMSEFKPKYNFHEFKFDQSSLTPSNKIDNNPLSLFPAYKLDKTRSHSDAVNKVHNLSRQESQSGYSPNIPPNSRPQIGVPNLPLNSRSQIEGPLNLRPSDIAPVGASKSRAEGNTSHSAATSVNSRSQMPPHIFSTTSFSNNNNSNNSSLSSFLSKNANANITYPIQDRYSSGKDPRSFPSSIKPKDVPLPTYPRIPDERETPQSPENEATFSPDLNDDGAVKTIPLENESSEFSEKKQLSSVNLEERKRLPSVNMEAIQKALNFINAHDKRPEPKKVSYRYEDFVGPANSTSSDYYDPEESWQSSQEQFGNKDVDLRSKDVDLRQIPGHFIPPNPLLNAQYHNLKRPDPRYSVNAENYPANANIDVGSMWYKRGSVPPNKESRDVDMRSLVCGSPQQNVTYGTMNTSKCSSNLQTNIEPKINIENTKNNNNTPDHENFSKKIEPSKLDTIRNRIAHDQDKIIKLGQKGVAASQLESYKQRREKYSMPTKHPPSRRSSDSSDISNASSINKKSSVTVLDELIPETEEEIRKDPDIFAKKDTSIHKSIISKSEIINKSNIPLDTIAKSSFYDKKTTNLAERTSLNISLLKKGENLLTGMHKDNIVNASKTSELQDRSTHTLLSDHTIIDQSSDKSPKLPRNDQSSERGSVSENISRDAKSDISNKTAKPDSKISKPFASPKDKSDISSSTKDNLLQDIRVDSLKDHKDKSQDRSDDIRESRSNVLQNARGITMRDPRADSLRDPRTDSSRELIGISRDPRTDTFRDPRPNAIRDSRSDNLRDSKIDSHPRTDIPRDHRPEQMRDRLPNQYPKVLNTGHPVIDPRFDKLPRDPRSEITRPMDPRSDTFLLKGNRPQIGKPLLPLPVKRDPRLNIDHRGVPRPNIPPLRFHRDPRMGPVRDGLVQGFQPSQLQYNLDTRWNAVGSGPILRLPFPTPQIPQVSSTTNALLPLPGVAPQNSAIGQTFTCLMMQGLPRFANSSHIYRFFEEYLLRDLCIELDDTYECKGTAYIHFPTHISAKEALERENGKSMNGYKIYLRICSVGILRQAKATNGVQNFDREKYLNIPSRPKGTGNPFYKPKLKEPPPKIKEKLAPLQSNVTVSSNIEEMEKEPSKQGYSNLCGVKVDVQGSKNLQSFKIPKLKKAISLEESANEHKDKNENMDKSKVDNDKIISVSEESKPLSKNKSKIESKKNFKVQVSKIGKGRTPSEKSSSSDSEELIAINTLKKNRRYHKIRQGLDSDSESEKEETLPSKKSPIRNKSQSKFKTEIETDDSENESSLTIDESAPVSEKGSDSSDVETLEKEIKPIERRKRGRPFQIKGRKPLDMKPKINFISSTKKRGRKRKGDKTDPDFGKAKITRLKHVEFKEILSPKKKLQVIIPLPLKTVYSTFFEDMLPKRGLKRSRALAASPTPSETLSDALSTSTSVSNIHDLSEIGSSLQSQKHDTFDSFDMLASDVDMKTTTSGHDAKKISVPVVDTRKPKRRRNDYYSWQKGYKSKSSNICAPDIFTNQLKNRKRSFTYSSSYKSQKRMKPDQSIINKQEEKVMTSFVTNHTSVFDYGILDELPDLTQITPSITDNLLPELTSLESVIRADMDLCENSSIVTSEKAKERIKMISNDLLETANKFTEKESRERRSGELLPIIFPHEESKESKSLGNDEEEEEVNISLKVDQLVESLDHSISSESNMHQPQMDNNVNVESSLISTNNDIDSCENAVANLPVSKRINVPLPNEANVGLNVNNTLRKEKDLDEAKENSELDLETEENTNKEFIEANKNKEPIPVDDKNEAVIELVVKTSDIVSKDTDELNLAINVKTDTNITADKKPVENITSNNEIENENITNKSKIQIIAHEGSSRTLHNTIEDNIQPNDLKDNSDVDLPKECKNEIHTCEKNIEENTNNKKDEIQMVSYPDVDKINNIVNVEENAVSDASSKSNKDNISDNTIERNNQIQSTLQLSDIESFTNSAEKDVLKNKLPLIISSVNESLPSLNETKDKMGQALEKLSLNNSFSQVISDVATTKINDDDTTEIDRIICDADAINISDDSTTKISENLTDQNVKCVIDEKQDTLPSEIKNLTSSSQECSGKESAPVANICESPKSKVEKPLLDTFSNAITDGGEKPVIDPLSSVNTDAGADSDMDDGASVGLSSVCSIPDDNSIVSNEGRDAGTPEIPISSSGKKSRREKYSHSSSLIERRRITRGSLVVPQVEETILWDDGGRVDLFQCDQCDYVGKQRVSHLINFHSEREVPCEFRKEDYNPVLRDYLGPSYPPTTKKVELDLSWIPHQMIFDEEIECQEQGCDYTSNNRFDFIYHLLEHSPEAVPYVFHCRLCNLMSDNLTHFYDHVTSHTGEYRHTCDRCGQKGFSVESLVLHHKDYHGSQSQEIRSEEMVLEDNFPYIHVCRSCHHVQIKLNKIEEHIQLRHNGKSDYIKANMSRHITLHSEKKKESECSINIKKKYPSKILGISIAKKNILKKPLRGKRKGKRFIRKKGKKKIEEIIINKKVSVDKTNEESKMESDSEKSSIMMENESIIDNKNEDSDILNKNKDQTIETTCEKLTEEKENEKLEQSKSNEDSTIDISVEEPIIEKIQKSKMGQNEKLRINMAMNVDVFLGNEEEDHATDDGLKEKNVEELVNRILLNNYTSKSSSEIKKKISNLDDILKKVDESFVGKDMNVTDTGSECDNLNRTSKKESSSETPSHLTDSNSKVMDVAEPRVIFQFKKAGSLVKKVGNLRSINSSENIDSLKSKSADSDIKNDITSNRTENAQTTDKDKIGIAMPMKSASQTSLTSSKIKSKESPIQLTGLISRLQNNLSKEDVLEKIKLSQNISMSIEGEDDQNDDDDDDDSDSDNNLVICEDDLPSQREEMSSTSSVDPKPCLLRVKPPEQLFPPKQEPKMQISGPVIKCRISTCFYKTTSQHDLSVHLWTTHNFYMCSISDCTFISKLDDVFNYHILGKHQVKNLECPFICNFKIVFPSDLIKHICQAHPFDTLPNFMDQNEPEDNFLRIESVRSLDPESASRLFHNEGDYSTNNNNNNNNNREAVAVKKSSEAISLHPSSKLEVRDPITGSFTISSENSQTEEAPPKIPALLIPKKETPSFPAEETLPSQPPTVPLLPLFLRFQSLRAFTAYTMNKASDAFKCMVVGCTFSTDEPKDFEGHSDNHFTSDHRCCYCLIRVPSGKKLVEHILEEHSHCSFQCKYCLYRASTKIYLGVHLRKFHPEKEPRYIKVATLRSDPPPNPAIEKFVHPYQCTFGPCSFRSVDTDAFKSHLNSVHGQNIQIKCYFCDKFDNAEGMVEHMKGHMMNEFQCPYCLCGESERERLLTHLLNCHPGRPGKVLLRRQVSGGTSGIKPPVAMSGAVTTTSTATTTTITTAGVTLSFGVTCATTTAVSNLVSSVTSTFATPTPINSLSTEKIKIPLPPGSSGLHLPSTGPLKESPVDQTGLTGTALYRCGNEKCEYSCATQRELKEHLQVCDFSRDSPLLKCFHCSKNFRHLSGLLDHIKVHGPKRYKCGVEGCDYRGTMLHYFKNHMKQVHHHSSFKPVLKDFSNKDPETQEYIVYPKDIASTFKEPHKKRRNEFGVDDIDKIPRPHISYQELKCYHCMYSTKIRLNLVKHLKLHKKYPNGIPPASSFQDVVKSIPTKQPINPVPRLERPDLMFDKMMNLAGSSFEDKKKMEENELRIKHPVPQGEFDKLPGYIPDEKLNSCGIDGCKYLSCDETMLKYHIRTLHSEVEYFTCPHCVDFIFTLDKIGAHLKLHGDTLYRCGWCSYLTPRKALVERHLKETHPNKVAFDFCIRGTDGLKEENETKEECSPKRGEAIKRPRMEAALLGRLTQRLLPEDSSLHETPLVDGASLSSSSNNASGSTSKNAQSNQEPQWQCGICPFKSLVQNEMVNHTSLKHGIKSQYKCGYCQVRSSVRTAFDGHFASKHPDKAFRVLCMYYRLDSDDIEPLPPGGSTTSHEPLWRRNDPERKKQIRGILLEENEEEKETSIWSIQPGNSQGEEFVCPKCLSFKTPCVNTFRSHLCKEANYQRFECAECGITNPLLPSLRRHYTKTHGSQFTVDCYITLPIESTSEAWVESIISHQQHMIKIFKENEGGANFSSPSKSSSRRSSNQSDIEEASGIVIHDSGSDKTRYTCPICGVECKTGSGLKSHTTAMHQAKFKCQYCPYSSNTELAISNHRTLKHPKLENSDGSKLVGASSGYESEGAAPEETKKGTDKKGTNKFDCPHCDFRAPTSRVFYAHTRSHLQFRDYLCEYCGSRFESLRDANRHSSFKHSSMPAQISHSPLEPKTEKDNLDKGEKDKKAFKEDEKPRPVEQPSASPVKVCYSCCHCSIKGPYSFVEEHLKAQHRDLPFLLRKEEEKTLYLEVYKYRCGHCATDSDSLMEAMDHWVKNHVTLDFKFSLCLFTSTVIQREVTSTPSTSHDAESPAAAENKLSASPCKGKKKLTSAKPDSSIPSDLEESLEEDLDSSFSSSLVEGGGGTTDSEVEQQVSSSTSEQELLSKCGYCRKISKDKNVIIEHINIVHKDKPVKISLYQKGEKKRACKTESEGENVEKISRAKRAPRGSPKGRICFRCDVCSHVVKVRKSIKAHMDKVHPGDTASFTRIQFGSDFKPPTKQPIKCNYCGDTSATVEEMESHHSFLHSHLTISFTNLNDEALSSIHKSSSSGQMEEGFPSPSPSFEISSPLLSEESPYQSPRETSFVGGSKPPFIGARTPYFKNTARKSFPLKLLKKKQIATKSTSGRLQLVRLVKSTDLAADDEATGVLDGKSLSTSTCTQSAEQDESAAVNTDICDVEREVLQPLNYNEIYACVNLLGNAPMRLSFVQLSALLNLDPKVVLTRERKGLPRL